MTRKGQTTRLVHADRFINQPNSGAVHSPTSNSVLFEFTDVQDLVDVFQGKQMGHVYSRSSSPSTAALQNMVCDLEGGVGAVTFSTGMAAISALFLSLVRQGDHLIVSRYLFGNTRSFFENLSNFGVEISWVDVTDVRSVEQAVRQDTRAVFAETIANPVTQVADLSAIGRLCASKKLLFIIDTTMTPGVLFDAQKVNASLTVASLTKYYAGHGNVLGGVIVDTGCYDWTHFPHIAEMYKGADEKQWGLTQIRKKGLRDLGGTLSPHAAHQIAVGMETMSIRLQRSCDNALRLATYLHGHPNVKQVFYPGLADHPQHFLARETFGGMYGGIFSIDLDENVDCFAFLNALKLVINATHLGDTRTLALPVAHTIYFENGPEERAAMGISDNLIRFSVGIEDIDDIVADFEQAFHIIGA
ncbi:cystathionine gamma-synthase family protein [Aestuariibacter halophilus]|uniref:Cystathionine gamma-synthase family protein n=1 Tax=Fluctibacter halophilus TaxID=226011 RepID=A0ABS8G5T8_9ALTE|nr:cystathionine gamma-synthase family protein [Aestuariibacter halophilus]MCC2615768.1 cystathionine gamma-synthase family protein [Aestuariibacter halophilus]